LLKTKVLKEIEDTIIEAGTEKPSTVARYIYNFLLSNRLIDIEIVEKEKGVLATDVIQRAKQELPEI